MRLVATVFLWLVTTIALAVAVPSMWAQRNVISEDGYAALAESAAKDPQLQSAMASVLTTQITTLAADNGLNLNSDLVRGTADAYTTNAGFPGQFAQASRIGHRFMFTNSIQPEEGSDNRWLIDIAPMLNDPSLRETLGDLDLGAPPSLTVPMTAPEMAGERPGQLRPLSTWGPWVSVGATILTGVFALLTLAAARARGKALAALGVSALLVGAAGWAGLEVLGSRIDDAFNQTAGEFRQVAEVMVDHGVGSLHQWLNLTLAAGGVLVVFGVAVALLGGLRRE
jgi:hypothetical protein